MNGSRAQLQVSAQDVGEVLVAAMTLGGIDHLFFTSGSEIAFYQEAIAKAQAMGQKAPRLITMTHEHTSLNAALGYAAVSGKPVVTAAHVDLGTINYGGAIHTASHSRLPVLITAGAPPTAYPGSMRGARDSGVFWLQQTLDQNGIVRQYMKWDHRLEYQDNPGLIVSRALQIAKTEPCGPVYLSIPREIVMLPVKDASFPTVDHLGVSRPPAPDPAAIGELTERLLKASNPVVIVSGSGRHPATVPALVELCELLALPVMDSVSPAYHCFPMNHRLYQKTSVLKEADFVLVLDAAVPWVLGVDDPGPDAFVAVVGIDPVQMRTPMYEFTANLRVTSDPLQAIHAITAAAKVAMPPRDHSRFEQRAARWADVSAARRRQIEEDACAQSTKVPIDPRWLCYQIGKMSDDNWLVLDDTIIRDVREHLPLARPGAYFHNPGSSGGWAPGAALGAKLAAPDRDVVAVTGDGFYMFGTANAALWAAAHYKAPFLMVVFQNRSYRTGVLRVASAYPDGYAAKGGFEGGYFDPPIDFAKEAQACGAYGENVKDPSEIGPALKRGLGQTRQGTPAVISVWLPRLLQQD